MHRDHSAEYTNVTFNGSLNQLGTILSHYYRTTDRIKRLLSLGNLAAVGKLLEASPLLENGDAKDALIGNLDKLPRTQHYQIQRLLDRTNQYFTVAESSTDNQKMAMQHIDDYHDLEPKNYNYLFVPNHAGTGQWYYLSNEYGDADTIGDTLNYGNHFQKLELTKIPHFQDLKRHLARIEAEMTDIAQYFVFDQFKEKSDAYHAGHLSLADLTKFLQAKQDEGLVEEYDRYRDQDRTIGIEDADRIYQGHPYLFDYTDTKHDGTGERVQRNYGKEYQKMKQSIHDYLHESI